MTDDPYAAEVDELWAEFNLPPPSGNRDRLAAEIEDRRGLKVEESQRVDLPSSLQYAVKLIGNEGQILSYGHGEHPRQAAIDALRRLLEDKHDREF